MSGTASAQDKHQAALTFEDARGTVKPVTDLVAGLYYLLALVWDYLMSHPAAAVLLSSMVAGSFAYSGIRQQRAIARIRETFATLNRDNWDKDVIDARNKFGVIKAGLGDNPGKISEYCVVDRGVSGDAAPTKAHIKDCVTLLTILNDYENIALGVRHDIIDELFLFRWMRGTLLDDWAVLTPLITEYRTKLRRPSAYIEFEGLASAWSKGESFRNHRRLFDTKRVISVR